MTTRRPVASVNSCRHQVLVIVVVVLVVVVAAVVAVVVVAHVLLGHLFAVVVSSDRLRMLIDRPSHTASDVLTDVLSAQITELLTDLPTYQSGPADRSVERA